MKLWSGCCFRSACRSPDLLLSQCSGAHSSPGAEPHCDLHLLSSATAPHAWIYSPSEASVPTIYCGNKADTTGSHLCEPVAVHCLSFAPLLPGTHLSCGCRYAKQAVICKIENEGVWTSSQVAARPGSWQAAVECELHLTSFFLFLTLGILPSFIFLAFFFFCGLRESVSENRLSRGVRGTVLRSASSSSSRKKTKNKNVICKEQHRCSQTNSKVDKGSLSCYIITFTSKYNEWLKKFRCPNLTFSTLNIN